MKHVVSFSGGKDSTAMLLRMIELDYQIDEVLFADTGLKLPEIYDYIDRVEEHIGMKITKVSNADKTFEDYFYEIPSRGKYHDEGKIRGLPPAFGGCYINRDFKLAPIEKYLKQFSDVHQYIGIALDESHRAKTKAIEDNPIISHFPLIEWGWREKDCTAYLINQSMPHPLGGLRTGCWLCPNQTEKDLYYLYTHHPDLWSKLGKYVSLSGGEYGVLGKDLGELEQKFEGFNRYQTRLL